MAELLYFTGPMDCGKSTLALQFDYTHSVSGRKGRLFTSKDRAGEATISSRLGLTRPAIEVRPAFDFWVYVVGELTSGQRVDYLVCDETQFYATEQIDQLARIVDELQIDVFAVGIMTDFRTRMFPGSQRLVELCDKIETLQARALCWCGEPATHNARTIDGVMVTEGDQVVVGDTATGDPATGATAKAYPASADTATGDIATKDTATGDFPTGDIAPQVAAYEVLCRRHHRRRVSRAVARATLSDPLPFDREEPVDLT